jgi:hypothetical protein
MEMTMHGGTVRLTMSAKVAGDLGALQKGLKSLAERLGHANCMTGCDITHLGMEREFTFGGVGQEVQLNLQPLHRSEPVEGPQPQPWRPVTVAIPDKVSRDINSLTEAAAIVLGKLGCPQYCSGFDIVFRREVDMLAIDETLNVNGFGRFA